MTWHTTNLAFHAFGLPHILEQWVCHGEALASTNARILFFMVISDCCVTASISIRGERKFLQLGQSLRREVRYHVLVNCTSRKWKTFSHRRFEEGVKSVISNQSPVISEEEDRRGNLESWSDGRMGKAVIRGRSHTNQKTEGRRMLDSRNWMPEQSVKRSMRRRSHARSWNFPIFQHSNIPAFR
jgi:hypothetical protein